MSRPPFVTAAALAADLADGARRPPVVVDATLVLHRPRFDGDFSAESGRPGWLAERIPGAIHLAVDTDLSVPDATHDRHPEPQDLADALARAGIGGADRVVVYDRAGGLWAARVWYLLRWIGVPVEVLDGGLAAWRSAGLPLESGEPARRAQAAHWIATAVRAAWVEREELQDATGTLVCALSRASFEGTEPTRYFRRGHIPGSVNVPARALVDRGGSILPSAQVEHLFRDAGVDLDAEILLYCGGGISATASALALASIGIDSMRVYDGSLEEWSADPSLPLTIARI